MVSEGGRARLDSLTREEFERLWESSNDHPKSPALVALVQRYNAEITRHPFSLVNLWRLQTLESEAAKHVARWNDPEQPAYEEFLIMTLNLVHGARWRKVISPEESDRILAAAVSVLGEEATGPSYGDNIDLLASRRDRPNSRESLAAIIGMLDILGETQPEMRDRFMARVRSTPARGKGRHGAG